MRPAPAALAAALAAAFALLWWAVASGMTDGLDLAWGAGFAAAGASKPIHAAAGWITQMGTGAAGCAVALAATALLLTSGRARLAGPLWTAFLGAEATTWAVKLLEARPRPTFVGTIAEVSPSFPSAHATVAVSVYGFVALAALGGASAPLRRTVVILAALLVVLIGASRVLLGVHFLTDVLAGTLVGGAWLLGVTAWLEPPSPRNSPSGSASGP